MSKARDFAFEKHANQKYGKLPYSYHLQQVVSKLIYWKDISQFFITDHFIEVAWLHDVLEDTDTPYEELRVEFGKHVADDVRLLSKNYLQGEYIPRIQASPVALLVKIADTICNLEASLLSGEMRRVNKYSKQLALLTEI